MMNNKEHKEYLEVLKKYSQRFLSSKKEAEAFLIRAGIHNTKGELSKPYTYSKK